MESVERSDEMESWKKFELFSLDYSSFFLFFSLIVINQGSSTFDIPMSLICSELVYYCRLKRSDLKK